MADACASPRAVVRSPPRSLRGRRGGGLAGWRRRQQDGRASSTPLDSSRAKTDARGDGKPAPGKLHGSTGVAQGASWVHTTLGPWSDVPSIVGAAGGVQGKSDLGNFSKNARPV